MDYDKARKAIENALETVVPESNDPPQLMGVHSHLRTALTLLTLSEKFSKSAGFKARAQV